jgi:hypothetical protein
MTSCFSAGDETVWVSNGTAEELELGWARRLEGNENELSRSVARFLRQKVEQSGPGMYGFRVDEVPFDAEPSRRLLAAAAIALARDSVAALYGTRPDETLEWFVRHEPFYQARWLANQERIYELIAGTLPEGLPPLALAVQEELRAAIDAMKLADVVLKHSLARKLAPNRQRLERELVHRRAWRDKIALAPGYFTARYLRSCLYDLADLEEALGMFNESAETTTAAADLEEDPSAAEIARQVAAARASR